MSVVTVSDFLQGRFLKFKDSPLIGELQDILDESEQDTPYKAWGTRQARAIKLLTAHKLTKYEQSESLGGLAIGAITSISASQESQSLSWNTPSASGDTYKDWLLSTVYGTEYEIMRSRLPMMGFRSDR